MIGKMDGRTLNYCILNGINLKILSKLAFLILNVRPNGRPHGLVGSLFTYLPRTPLPTPILYAETYKCRAEKLVDVNYWHLSLLIASFNAPLTLTNGYISQSRVLKMRTNWPKWVRTYRTVSTNWPNRWVRIDQIDEYELTKMRTSWLEYELTGNLRRHAHSTRLTH